MSTFEFIGLGTAIACMVLLTVVLAWIVFAPRKTRVTRFAAIEKIAEITPAKRPGESVSGLPA